MITLQHWIGTAGGPHGIATPAVVNRWNVDHDDYSRACECRNILEIRTFYDSQIVLLGDVPAPVAVVDRGNMLYIVKWLGCDSEQDALGTIDFCKQLTPHEQQAWTPELNVDYFLFDTGRRGPIPSDSLMLIGKFSSPLSIETFVVEKAGVNTIVSRFSNVKPEN
jgi:hypothetical protein